MNNAYIWRDHINSNMIHFGDSHKNIWFSLLEDGFFEFWNQEVYDQIDTYVTTEPLPIRLDFACDHFGTVG